MQVEKEFRILKADRKWSQWYPANPGMVDRLAKEPWIEFRDAHKIAISEKAPESRTFISN